MIESPELNPVETSNGQGFAHDPTPGRQRRPDLASLTDVRREMARVYRAMKAGKVATQDGTRLTYVLTSIGKLIESSDLQKRLEALEASLAARKN